MLVSELFWWIRQKKTTCLSPKNNQCEKCLNLEILMSRGVRAMVNLKKSLLMIFLPWFCTMGKMTKISSICTIRLPSQHTRTSSKWTRDMPRGNAKPRNQQYRSAPCPRPQGQGRNRAKDRPRLRHLLPLGRSDFSSCIWTCVENVSAAVPQPTSIVHCIHFFTYMNHTSNSR